MQQFTTPILVVDDTKFSNFLVSKTLQSAGFTQVTKASSALQALSILEKNRVSIVVVDWIMPTMDGLEFTQYIRTLDKSNYHYTYIILLTAKECNQSLYEAFSHGIDDFICKSDMKVELIPRILSALRLSALINQCFQEKQILLNKYCKLKNNALVDIKTGISNTQHLKLSLENLLKHAFSRGGYPCLLILQVLNHDELLERLSVNAMAQLTEGITMRLRQNTRPMDTVAHIDTRFFGIASLRNSFEECKRALHFKRLIDAANFKVYPTENGYVTIQVSMRVCYLQPKECLLIPKVQSLFNFAIKTCSDNSSNSYISTYEFTNNESKKADEYHMEQIPQWETD